MLGPVESLVVRESKTITKPEDLAGKTAAAPFGSTTHYLIIAYLRAGGGDPNTVKHLSLPIDDATRMMKGTKVVPCAEQITGTYLGTSRAKGKFVDTLVSTATFLTEQKRLPKIEARATYEEFIV